MPEYVWKLDVEYPADSLYPDDVEPEWLAGRRRYDWEPEGWEADEEYIHRYGTDEFFWPKVERVYRTRDTAVRRAQLLEKYGATVHLLRSKPLEWEERTFPGKLQQATKAVVQLELEGESA